MHSATCIHEKIFIIILQNVKCINSVYENRNIQYVCFCLEKVMLMICWLIFSSVPHCLPDVDVWHVERSHLTELYAGATAEPHFPSFSQYFPILVSLYIYMLMFMMCSTWLWVKMMNEIFVWDQMCSCYSGVKWWKASK